LDGFAQTPQFSFLKFLVVLFRTPDWLDLQGYAEVAETAIARKQGFTAANISVVTVLYTEPVFVNLLRRPEIDSQPGGIDSWAP
jgi:hypothetical protein